VNALHVNQLLSTPGDVLRLAGALLGVIAALYLLKPRQRRVEVPFGGLWQKVLAESEARVVGRNLRRLLSFLLMLLLAGLCLASLADPLFGRIADGPRMEPVRPHTVVIVDVSASMQTDDGQNGTRLAEAQTVLRQWLLAAPADEDVLLLAASGHAEVLAGWGSDRATLDERVSQLRATDGGLDLRRAIDTAQQALAHRQQPRIVLVSDAGPAELPLDVTPAATIEHLRVGPARAWQMGQVLAQKAMTNMAPMTNLAVVDLRVRPDPQDPSRGTLTVQVRNDSGQDVAAQLLLAGSDTAYDAATFGKTEALRRIVDVQLPPGLSTQTVPGVELTSARFAVQVRGKAGLRDVAPWDDWGFAVLAERKELGVLVVSGGKDVDPATGNLYLAAALFAHGKVKVQHVAGADYRPEQFAAHDRARHGVDVVVLDQAGFALPEGMPGLILSLAGAPTETLHLAQGPELVVRDEDHPAMRGISFQDTNFDKVRLLPSRPHDHVLAAVKPRGAVMVARQENVRSLEWGIDLLETDLGARYSLPLLVSNALLWLAGQEESLVPPLLVGRPWAVDAPVDANWHYIEPGQLPRPARTSGRQLLGQSERHGVHVWQSDGDRLVARATVLAPTENPTLLQPWGPAAKTLPPSHAVVQASHGLPRWSLWLLAAMLLLAVEWLAYLRRRTV
jgi:hypothetical protein